jgi:pyruvate formate lyase activating enzyme
MDLEQLLAGCAGVNAETEEGDIFDIQRFSVNDGPGIRTIVFFKSCPLQCLWCSNPESQLPFPELLYSRTRCLDCDVCISVCSTGALAQDEAGIAVDHDKCDACGRCVAVCPGGALRIAGHRTSVECVLAEVLRDRIFYDHSGGGMTLSGGEPLMQPEFALALLRRARQIGIHTAVETCGSTSAEVIRRVLSQADLILYDIKHMDSAKHRAGIGKSNGSILRNARLAASLGVEMIARVPVIPGFNDSLDEILAIGRFARDIGLSELHLLLYHRYGVSKYSGLGRTYALTETASPSESEIQTLRTELQALGLRVRVGG